jgi:hypothetical protein
VFAAGKGLNRLKFPWFHSDEGMGDGMLAAGPRTRVLFSIDRFWWGAMCRNKGTLRAQQLPTVADPH